MYLLLLHKWSQWLKWRQRWREQTIEVLKRKTSLKNWHCAASEVTCLEILWIFLILFTSKLVNHAPTPGRITKIIRNRPKFCYSPWKDLPRHLTVEIDHFNFPVRENVPGRFSRRIYSELHEKISHEPEVFAMRVPKFKQAKLQWQIYWPHDTRSNWSCYSKCPRHIDLAYKFIVFELSATSASKSPNS